MNAIMYSSNPKQTARVLNKEQTVIILKSIPVEWKEWLKDQSKPFPKKEIYLYCTKGKDYVKTGNRMFECSYVSDGFKPFIVNGKVVAKCVVGKVRQITHDITSGIYFKALCQDLNEEELLKQSCLRWDELEKYLLSSKNDIIYAYEITQLEIFDKPRELGEFYRPRVIKMSMTKGGYQNLTMFDKITKAPQSWCYIESEEK